MTPRRLPMVKRIDALEEKIDFLLNTVSLSRVVESPTGPVQAKATLGEIFESFRNKGVEHEPQDTTAGLAGNIPTSTGTTPGDHAGEEGIPATGNAAEESPASASRAYLESVRSELIADRK
tara:strand:- start:6646 stop:7008 length:363 start_codon:yes stop_codon:yes gene_type:complete